MRAPWRVEYAGATFVAVTADRPRFDDPLNCEQCGGRIRAKLRHYRTKQWGPNKDKTVRMHQKCLLGQLDPTIWDIK